MKRTKKLHIGCFASPHEGWLNTDITPHILISRIPLLPLLLYRLGRISKERFEQHQAGVFKEVHRLDITKPFPFKDGTFEAVFSSHVLEHLFPDQARNMLREISRIMAPGAVLRLTVPDLDRHIAAYDPHRADEFCDAIFESRHSHAKNQHHWMYNEYSLAALLHDIGFSEIVRCQYRQGKCPDVQTLDNRPSSLFVEATK